MPRVVRHARWHTLRELRGGFFLRPGAIAMALAATAVGLAAVDQARRLAAACARGFPDDDATELGERLEAVERSAADWIAPGPGP